MALSSEDQLSVDVRKYSREARVKESSLAGSLTAEGGF